MFNISENKCVGCGICQSLCPEAVEVLDGISRIKSQKDDCLKKAMMVCPQQAIKEIRQDLLVAIGTDDNKTIKSDDHVGSSKYFQIWKYSEGELIFQEKRENQPYEEDEKEVHGDPGKAKATASVLAGVDVVAGRIFGPNIVRLKNKFVCVVIRKRQIEEAIEVIKKNINEIVEEYDKKERKGIVLS